MAIIRVGPLAGAISGNLGGQNFVNGRAGPYVRTRLKRINKATQRQHAHQARYQTTVIRWRTLTDDQRNAWRTASRNLFRSNRLGTRRPISGFQLYVQHNLASPDLVFVQTTPPHILLRTNAPEDLILTASATGPINLTWYANTPPISSSVFTSAARSVSTRQPFHVHNWLLLGVSSTLPGARGGTITTRFDAALGHPFEGEVISVKVAFRHPNYMTSFYVPASTVVTA